MNVKGCPVETLSMFGAIARHPDALILDLADLEPAVVTTAAKRQRAALKEPLSPEDFVSKLQQQGLPGVAAFLQKEGALIRVIRCGSDLNKRSRVRHLIIHPTALRQGFWKPRHSCTWSQ